MATTIKSESQLQRVLELGLVPDPIVISKGGFFSVVNFGLGDNLEVVTESGPVPDYFFKQIYDPTIIVNLILGVGVTMELDRDIFVSGSFNNLGGTVTGGQVFVVNIPLVLPLMGYSWEADLGLNEIGGEADSWVDNIEGIALQASSVGQRPIVDPSDADFKGLPSLQGESAFDRQMRAAIGLNINSFEVTVFVVKLDTTAGVLETDATLGEVDPRLFLDKIGANAQRAFAIGNTGNTISELPGPQAVSVYRTTWDINLPVDETNVFRNGSNAGLIRGVNLNNTEQLGSGMPFTIFSRFNDVNFSNAKIVAILIYPAILNAAQNAETELYLTNKWIP